MGLLDRLHKIDEPDDPAETGPPPETAERVNAILAVISQYLDPANTMGATLFVIARRELAQASPEQLDIVIHGILRAAEDLRRFLVPALPAAETTAPPSAAPAVGE